jgi:hypothetical protein
VSQTNSTLNKTNIDVKSASQNVTGRVTVGGGSYKDEVKWVLTCNGTVIVDINEGIAPYDRNVTVPKCSLCTLDMTDTYSDSWSDNYWVGFGQRETVTNDDNGGKSKSI